jgi:hypothetical protein
VEFRHCRGLNTQGGSVGQGELPATVAGLVTRDGSLPKVRIACCSRIDSLIVSLVEAAGRAHR